MKFLASSLLVLALVVPAQAAQPITHQWGGWGNWGNNYGYYSSTAAQGYLTGLGQLYQGQGSYLVGLGKYQIMHQQAHGMYINNWEHNVKAWQHARDENKARKLRDNPNWITLENQRLDLLEQRFALEQRKKALIQAGVLAPPPQSAFFHNGVKYNNYQDFKNSPAHDELIAEGQMQTMRYNLEQRAETQRLDSALRFLAKWHGMSYCEQKQYQARRYLNKILNNDVP